MRNKKIILSFLFLLMILAVCVIGFPKDRTVESIWTGLFIKIDGSDDDWTDGALNFEKKVKVDYMFKNDAKGFFILFIFKDLKYLSSIDTTGLTTWLNTEGKKKKKYGVSFKTERLTADQLISNLEKQQGPLPESKKKQIKSSPNYLFFQSDIIDRKGNILTADALKEGIEAPVFKFKYQKEKAIYEFRIPFKAFDSLFSDQRIEPGKVIKVGFEWGGMTKEMKKAMMRQAGSASASTTRLNIGDNPADTRSAVGKSSGSRVRGPQKYLFWVDVKLAQDRR